jgi:hypothetical protein
MNTHRIKQYLGRGRVGLAVAAAACLAVVGGVPGVGLPAAVASARTLTWTQLPNGCEPCPAKLAYEAMAYDAATRDILLFGGGNQRVRLWPNHDTYTWNATGWTYQMPATRPPGRALASMAYDAATRTVIMFGGYNGHHQVTNGTFVWHGTTWTEAHRTALPPARQGAAIAYDAATRTVVMFGGANASGGVDGDTWSWNGKTWTELFPVTSPPALAYASMAYDADTGTVVLFGGSTGTSDLGDTWTWNGTTWTRRHFTTSPHARQGAAMAYDAATGAVVMYGGLQRPNGKPNNDFWALSSTPPAGQSGAPTS